MNDNQISTDALLWEGERWASVPLSLFTMDEISVRTRFQYSYLLTYVNPRSEMVAFPSQSRMAEELAVGERSIRGWLLD